MSSPTRTYSNGTLTVEWWSHKCTHCQACVIGLPHVFNVDRRPWINLDADSDEAIYNQVLECPSGALVAELIKGQSDA